MITNNASNKFGPSSFVVGPVLGDGCNYTSIQTAINDAALAGGSSVILRAGTYTENLSLVGGVDLLGVSGDARPPGSLVQIVGNHTMTTAGFSLLSDIGLSAAAGDVFTLTAPPGGFSVVGLKFCRVDAPAGSAIIATGTAPGNGAAIIAISSLINSSAESIIATDASIQMYATNVTSNTSYAISLNGNSGMNGVEGSVFNGDTAAVLINSATANCRSKDCTFSSSNGPSFLFGAAGNVSNTNTLHGSSGISGFYVEGTGTYQYAGDYFDGTNNAIDPLVSVNTYVWKPWGEGAAAALGAVRGTSAFLNTDFSVTDGFVSLSTPISSLVSQVQGNTGSATPVGGILDIVGQAGCKTNGSGQTLTISAVDFTQTGVSGQVVQDTGWWIDAGTTVTLPVTANCVNGSLIEASANAATAALAADVGQTIRFGNVSGTLATASDIGDSVKIRFNSSTKEWVAMSIVGNWVIT